MSFCAGALLRIRRAFRFGPFACGDANSRFEARNSKFNPGFLRFAAALLTCAMVFTGCAPSEQRADLIIVNGAEPGSLDPATSKGLEELRIVMALWEGLMRVDPKTAEPIPGLAERHEVSGDGRVYTFHLRSSAKWSTGGRITAHDVVYSWLRVLDPATASEYAGQLFYIKNAEAFFNRTLEDPSQLGIRALDELTLRVELTSPTPFFLGLCAFQTLYVVPRQVIEKHGDRWIRSRPLPTSGPYELDEWQLNDRVRLRASSNYWDAANTRCKTVDLLPIRNAATAFNLYEKQAVDIIWDKEMIPSELFPVLRPRPDFHSFNYLGTYFLRFNTTRKPFDDPRVRKALVMTIDKQRLVDKILQTGEQIASHFVPPGTANGRSPQGLPYDPEGARKLLVAAGFPGGQGLRTIEYLFEAASGGGGSVHTKIGVELQQMWQRELGVKVELRQMEKHVYINSQSSLEYDVSRSTWIGDYNDPNTFLDLFRSNNGNNRTGWKNARYDQLMDEASQLTDLKRRAEVLRAAESILVNDDAPISPLYFFSGFNYYHPRRVHGIYGNILDSHPISAIGRGPAAD
jgi:oligopeptide transport system substrate-binding protein